jgi:rhodanese-related sulfurtransferase
MFKKLLFSFLLSSGFVYGEALHIGAVKPLLDEAERTVKQMDGKELKGMIDKYDKFVLIDLRGQAQIERGEIYAANSFKIERGYLEFQIEKNVPDKNTKLVLYCCSGKRSILAAESLMKMGYTDVTSLRGGVIEWVDKDFPLDTSFGEMISKHQ